MQVPKLGSILLKITLHVSREDVYKWKVVFRFGSKSIISNSNHVITNILTRCSLAYSLIWHNWSTYYIKRYHVALITSYEYISAILSCPWWIWNWLGIKIPETPDYNRQNHHQSHHIICSIKKVDESGGIGEMMLITTLMSIVFLEI